MRGSRGRILQALAGSGGGRDQDQAQARRDDQAAPAPQQPTSPRQETPSTTTRPRGRGGFIQRQLLAQQERQAPQAAPPSSGQGGDEPARPMRARQDSASSSSQSEARPLSRQLSGSSVSDHSISQQFASLETRSYKADLFKHPSQLGSQVTLGLNYMTFETKDGLTIEEYHVEFNPNIESTSLRYRLLRSDVAIEKIGSVIHWTGTNLYLPKRLAQDRVVFESTHPVTDTPVKIRLTWVKTPPDSELLPFYNSLMHKVMCKLQYVIINRQHYSPLHKIAIEQHRLEVWPGWLTSIQRLDGGIKMCVDATFRVLRLQTVRDIMLELKTRCRGSNIKEAFEQELVGAIIMTKYNNRSYRIDEIDLTKKPSDTFTLSTGQELSYVDYMRQHWNITIQDLGQPLIVHRPKPKRGQEASTTDVIYLVPELCYTTGLTDEMRSNFTIMKAIGDHTRLPPNIREDKLAQFLQQLSTDERASTVLSDWGLSVSNKLDVVPGRKLDGETVILGNQRQCKVGDDADWTRAATNSEVFKTVDFENWVIFCPERDWNVAEDFMNSVREVARNLGIKFMPPRCVKLPNENTVTYVNMSKQHVKRSDQMVVLMTPGKSQREDRYSACKRLFTCEMPIPCQFIRCGVINNPKRIRSICQKIVIQMLSKVGGQPWAMRFPMRSFMIVGIDVYHDTIDRNKSCVGFVASMNEFTSAWWSQTFFQNSLEEIGQKLNFCMTSALRRYHTLNGFVPQRIIVYRDGVGDGQLESVLEIEIPQVVNGIKFYMRDKHEGEKDPQISYLIVQKRINAKLSLRQGNQVLNPPPGTFIDHTITHPEYNDFYLVSQHVNQGTVSPTKYILLTETGTLKLEHHQKLAYKMTHMYYNWTGTIRVPAPCQYAHKLAYLTGQNIRQQASDKLEDKLYYL